ncbi:transporter substrate-binding domain-containing protein [Chromobacterium subtsugae]|uniref:Transporter substrate-binding domain-containing protein n=1 Tax=Chromobacterium subtsugae TaxID=251747 RepID=A0ABS7F818_9NEIS|nr:MULTISPECIES: transporter substrate-binding domain-containing protein [Chromobacterium]MBW7567232.1 transporter substrate-binding domain-containing protein [Chromobacterium subtsugae]MBW8286202.1 transporter substrate-binding domain-containing protein [Chromobacterium subtsugae]WSE91745.1 transporter substrate-binding domain-containing protein [Chromobacterium subtsugae]WVH60119.1 transporter substrate-binding domain-containing protein [Chromobacterium subtsugae]
MKSMLACARALLLGLWAGWTGAAELLVSTGEYAPWSGARLPGQGFVNRVVREAFAREGVAVRFQYLPWARALEALRNGSVEASSFWFDDPDKAREFLYSAPLSEHRELLFHRKDLAVPAWARLQDLHGLRFGATRGYSYTAEFRQLAKQGAIEVEEADDDKTNLLKLLAGRIELFPIDEFTGWQLLASNAFPRGAHDLVTAEPRPFSIQYGHLLMLRSARNEQLMGRFNAGLAKLRADGTLERFRLDLYRGSGLGP